MPCYKTLGAVRVLVNVIDLCTLFFHKHYLKDLPWIYQYACPFWITIYNLPLGMRTKGVNHYMWKSIWMWRNLSDNLWKWGMERKNPLGLRLNMKDCATFVIFGPGRRASPNKRMLPHNSSQVLSFTKKKLWICW